MASKASNVFDRLPDEILEYIFMLITYTPPIEPSNHTIDPSTGLFYFSYALHKPYLRRTFKDLISIERVCQRFHNIIHSPTFWHRKCQRDHVVIVNEQLAIQQNVDFRRLYFSNPFHPDYNLLIFKNDGTSDYRNVQEKTDKLRSILPSFLHRHDTQRNPDTYKYAWQTMVVVEKIPVGCDILYDAFKQISPCFVTSYEWGTCRIPNISMIKQGQEKVSQLRTMIEFSVCTAGRWDCSYRYKLKLCFSDGHQWNHENDINDGDTRWHRITYRYGRYPIGRQPPNVSVEIQGKDGRYWAGHFGTKFAQIKLRLVLRDENNPDEEEKEEILKEPEICDRFEYEATHP